MENKFLARQGSSTLEFILCAPALLILMYVAMEINERIEQRTTATIAAGNASWLADPNSVGAASSDLKTTSKSDILGTKSNPATFDLTFANLSHLFFDYLAHQPSVA